MAYHVCTFLKKGPALMANNKVLTGKRAKELIDSGEPDFSGYTTLGKDAAVVLADYPGTLILLEVEKLTEEQAAQLSEHRGELHLYGLRDISTLALESLLQHKGFLGLGFPENTLTTEQAKALASFPWGLSLTPSPEWGEDWRAGLESDRVAILEQHPSMRFDYGTIETWLLERLGFDWDAKGTDWVPHEIRERLCASADAFEYCIPDDDGRIMGTGLVATLDVFRKTGRQQIHAASLRDDKETQLAFVGTSHSVIARITVALSDCNVATRNDDESGNGDSEAD